jgi:quinol monooxygenase YgiN
MKYGIYTKHTARPGKREDLVGVLLKTGDLLKANPDCVNWIVNTTDEPDVVWINVVWASKEAHDDALTPDSVRELMREAKEFLSDQTMPEQIFMTPVGGKGL